MRGTLGKAAVAVVAIAVGLGLAGQARAGLWEDVLFWLMEKLGSSVEYKPSPQSAELLADVKRYRAESGAMDAKKAADTWLELYDRAKKLSEDSSAAWDPESSRPLRPGSMLASLPGPDSWPALREGAKARVQRAPADTGALGLRFVTELLAGDRGAAGATLAEIERPTPGANRGPLHAQVAHIRAELARLYGSRADIAATFVASLDAHRDEAYDEVEVPDLVGLVGEAGAAAILREALAKPVRLHVPEGDRTRVLARRVALEQVEKLAVPQWGLVDGMDGAELYEALERRFGGIVTRASQGYDRRKSDADRYYFLHLVVKGRHADAEKAMQKLAGEDTLYLPKREIEALRRGGYHEAIHGFLHSVLARRPELAAWDVYTREAAYTGHSAQALALVEDLLKRKDLPADVLADLSFRRVNALLAADRIDPAVAELQRLLAAPPKQGEKMLRARTDAAVRLAGLGRVLERRPLSEAGLAFARASLALPAEREQSWRRREWLRQVLAEQRKLGLDGEALALVTAELERKRDSGGFAERYGVAMPSSARAAAVELASLHVSAKRYREVIALLEESEAWGARDLSSLLSETDSLGVPLALNVARALAGTGNQVAALAVARALNDALPGYDPAYEFLIGVDKDALKYLDAAYARDQFEERPLIWKAILFTRSGRWAEAESLIRRAIAIDPSDGEEGPNDRMRAYAVLAGVLEAKGAMAPAALFRRAVKAIRISERSDELHRLGLYERAFAGYREALEQFADAYCIQSRLAVRLMEQGRREEAFEHYRRAYELMPASFGRVESHCFGCESVFEGTEQLTLAEEVFNQVLMKDPRKPQAHYLLGYLNKERGRYPEALKRFRESVQLDPEYLNAWKHLNELGGRVYIEPRQRDRVRLKLLELDPRQRHVHYELDEVADLGLLWRAAGAAYAANKPAEGKSLYPLSKSAAALDKTRAKMPEFVRQQMEEQMDFGDSPKGRPVPTPRRALGQHRLMKASANLLD